MYSAVFATKARVLSYGVSVRDTPQHHALNDGAVLFLRQAAVGHQGSGQLGGRGGIDTLEPFVGLDLLKRRSFLGVPLQHMAYKTGGSHSED